MSLYGLATSLFLDIEKARAEENGQRNEFTTKSVSRSERQLPRLVSRGQDDGDPERITPTLELLEGCLQEIQKVRSRERPNLITQQQHQINRPSAGRQGDPFGAADNEGSVISCRPYPMSLSSLAFSETTQFTPDKQSSSPKKGVTREKKAIAGGAAADVIRDNPSGFTNAITMEPGREAAEKHTHHIGQPGLWRTSKGDSLRPPCLSSDEDNDGSGSNGDRGGDSGGGGTSFGKANLKADRGVSIIASEARATRVAMNDVAVKQSDAENETDTAATASFVEFEREIEDWTTTVVGSKPSLVARTNFAAHLSEKYLCEILDPMPSSPLVCRLRRRVARRIDCLASGLEGKTSQGATNPRGTREKQSGGALVEDSAVATPQWWQGNVKTSDRRSDYLKNETVDSRSTDSGLGDNLLVRRDDPSPKGWAGGNAGQPESSRPRTDPEGGSFADNSILTSWNGGEREKDGACVPRQGVGSNDNHSCSSSSSSRSSSGVGNASFSSGQRLAQEDLGPISNELLKFDARKPTWEEAQGRGYSAEELPPVLPRGDEQRRGDASAHPVEGAPRARTVRFLLEDSKEKDENKGRVNSRRVPTRGRADGEAFKVMHMNRAGRVIQKATTRHEVEAGARELPADGFWTCIVCRKKNDEFEGVQGCSTCGRRRPQQQRPQRHRTGEGAGMSSIQGNNWIARSGETYQTAMTSRVCGVTGGEASSRGTAKAKETIVSRDHRGPYDISSFLKMREATQPLVKARLGLTREISSLLSAIRK